eukprot:5893386-Pleurochrysis_carterae.AAC.1
MAETEHLASAHPRRRTPARPRTSAHASAHARTHARTRARCARMRVARAHLPPLELVHLFAAVE